MASPDHALYPSQESRLIFGRTLTLWLERGGWSHDIPLRWGKAAGFPAVADSTFNKLQRSKIEQPYPITFIQLGLLNARLADQDFSGVEDPALLARLAKQRPILHGDSESPRGQSRRGEPWIATDFFSHFIGEQAAPDWARERSAPTLEQAVTASTAIAERFRGQATAAGLTMLEAWRQFAAHVISQSPRRLSAEEVEVLRSVLSGWDTWTPEQLHSLIDPDDQLRPELALDDWTASLPDKSVAQP
jgi:hypothetical protein